MLDTLIITLAGIVIIIETICLFKLLDDHEILEELYDVTKEVIIIFDKKEHNEITLEEYNILLNDVTKEMERLENEYYE